MTASDVCVCCAQVLSDNHINRHNLSLQLNYHSSFHKSFIVLCPDQRSDIFKTSHQIIPLGLESVDFDMKLI